MSHQIINGVRSTIISYQPLPSLIDKINVDLTPIKIQIDFGAQAIFSI
jgi:hypothetical protein